MRLTRKFLNSCRTVRLYTKPKGHPKYPQGKYWTVPYKNAPKKKKLPLGPEAIKFFKPKGRGVPFACGVSNVIKEYAELMGHPVIYVQTIGTSTYVVVATDRGGMVPKFAYRYSHSMGRVIDKYDANDSIEEDLQKRKWLHLRVGLDHAKYKISGKSGLHNTRKQNLTGAALRAKRAGLIPSLPDEDLYA